MSARGAFVVVIGPDGVGKTTLARNLIAQWPASTRYVHFRPSIFARPDTAPVEEAPPPPPKRTFPGSRPIGWLRLAWSVVTFNFGYWRWLRPALREGALIVGDRWIYGYVGQPVALGFSGPEWLARAALNLVPGPDLLVRLKADSYIAAARKGDLLPEDISAEDHRWDGLLRPVLVVEASRAPGEIAEEVMIELRRTIESRHANTRS
ncbi:MAG TPA: hypothetical protein VJ935_06310 [Acidimicrobiia bacterium]|nr:hypothetical protein [Acidimicrobiia bacterium]